MPPHMLSLKTIEVDDARSDSLSNTSSSTSAKSSKGSVKRNFHSSVAITISSRYVRRALSKSQSRTAIARRAHDTCHTNPIQPGMSREVQGSPPPSNTLRRLLTLLVPAGLRKRINPRKEECAKKWQPSCHDPAATACPMTCQCRGSSNGVQPCRHPGSSRASPSHTLRRRQSSSTGLVAINFDTILQPKSPTSRRRSRALQFSALVLMTERGTRRVTFFDGNSTQEQLKDSLAVHDREPTIYQKRGI